MDSLLGVVVRSLEAVVESFRGVSTTAKKIEKK